MASNRSTPRRRPDRARAARGFSILELVVALGVSSIAMTAITKFFGQSALNFRKQSYRLEAAQASRATLDAITRDLRLAGACLPTVGNFVALEGTDASAGDTVTIRTGLVGADGSCIRSANTADLAIGATTIPVENASQFTTGTLLYLANANGSGEIVQLTGKAGNTLTIGSGLVQGYTASNAGVFALDERVYWLDKSDPAAPLLILQANWGPQQAFAVGVEDLQLRYVLQQNCPACDVVDAQALGEVEWRLVNEVVVEATVRTVGGVVAGDDVTWVAEARAKPRNLLP
jgi:prepilin-type N-terminal cleavage/methylation domain-containing protein